MHIYVDSMVLAYVQVKEVDSDVVDQISHSCVMTLRSCFDIVCLVFTGCSRAPAAAKAISAAIASAGNSCGSGAGQVGVAHQSGHMDWLAAV